MGTVIAPRSSAVGTENKPRVTTPWGERKGPSKWNYREEADLRDTSHQLCGARMLRVVTVPGVDVTTYEEVGSEVHSQSLGRREPLCVIGIAICRFGGAQGPTRTSGVQL